MRKKWLKYKHLRKGNIYEEDNQLWRVLDHQHIKVARGGATIRLKVRNLRTGSTVEKTYNNGARVKDVRLDNRRGPVPLHRWRFLLLHGHGDLRADHARRQTLWKASSIS